jgi:hypothetical protein
LATLLDTVVTVPGPFRQWQEKREDVATVASKERGQEEREEVVRGA